VFGEVIGRHESKDVCFQAFDVAVVEGFDRRILDGAVHSFGLAVGPGVIRLGQMMLDAMLVADTVEDVGAKETPGRAFPVLGRSAKADPLSVSTLWIL